MKILYLITVADLGGAQHYVLRLAEAFQGTIAAGSEKDTMFELAGKLNLPFVRLKHVRRNINLWHDLLAIFEIRNLIIKLKPDVIHLNSSKMGFLGSIAGKSCGCKIVYTAHGFAFAEEKNPFYRSVLIWAEKIASSFRNFTIAVSDADYNLALKYSLAKPQKLRVVHNGNRQINFLEKSAAREYLKLPPNAFIFGTIANLYGTKGIEVLIQAVNKINRPELIFAVIGDGPEKIQHIKLIDKLNLSTRVLLLGAVHNAADYLKAFDAVVLPSRKEGFPFVLLEAMSAGLPIAATDVGGVREALGDAGLIAKPGDVDSLSRAILELVDNKKSAENLSMKALLRSKEFTHEKMIQQTMEVYQNLK